MSNQTVQRAKDIGAHELAVTPLSQYGDWVKHPRGNFLVPREFDVQLKHKATVRQAPLNAVNGSAFLNGGQIEFKVDRNHVVSTLTHAYVRMDITNATGAAVTLAPTPFFIQRLEFIGNGGNVLAQFDGQELWLLCSMLSRDEWEKSAAYFGSDANYATTGVSVANGASTVLYLPLFVVLSAAKLHLAGLQNELTIRIQTQTSDKTILAGSHPTVTDVALILKGYQEPAAIRESRRAICQRGVPIKLPFVNSIDARAVITMAPSSRYEYNLSTIRANVIALMFTLRPVAFTGATQGTYQAISSFDVQLASGESVLGSYQRLHADNKLDQAEIFPNLMSKYSDHYFISFSRDPVGDFATGSVSGQLVFSGTEKLVINTPSTLVAGNYQLDLYALSCEHLYIEKCQLYARK